MFDIMFMRQKRNETARLIWIAPHGPFIRSIKVQTARGASSLEQMRLGHASTNSAMRSSVKRLNSAMNTNDSVI